MLAWLWELKTQQISSSPLSVNFYRPKIKLVQEIGNTVSYTLVHAKCQHGQIILYQGQQYGQTILRQR
jgi:hypothetical protein